MTHAELIFLAIREIVTKGITTFSRSDIRDHLGINTEDWNASYNPVFQGMRVDHPGGAPGVSSHFRDTIKRIDYGIYSLTERGIAFIKTESSENNLKIINESIVNTKRNAKPSTSYSHHKRDIYFSEKVQQILENTEIYHQTFYKVETFGKPCLYFHLQALKTHKNFSSIPHLEYTYATLIAWGMNRPGKGGSKMQDFATFSESILSLRDYISEAQVFDCFSMNEMKWSVLEKIFREINVMKSNTHLVGNSKVMHHLLPKVIPPIDRQYTLSYLRGNTTIRNDLTNEWLLMKKIISNFFIPIASANQFQKLANEWLKKNEKYPWDTSLMKIIDNIVVGAKLSTAIE